VISKKKTECRRQKKKQQAFFVLSNFRVFVMGILVFILYSDYCLLYSVFLYFQL